MDPLLLGLSAVVILGTAAQWLGWRIRLPSILLLLVFGILAGPVTGLIDPRAMLGPMLYPVVSLAVAVILFEGGLSLSLKEFRAVGGTVFRLVTVGMVVGWFLGSLAAHWLLGMEWSLSILTGAILVVTGPTVIIPLLRHIRPAGATGPILKWEGIVIDPLGAMLAVLVFQIITTGEAPLPIIAATVGKTLLVGAVLGVLGALVMVGLLKRGWIPDYLQNPVTLMWVVAVFVAAHLLQHESGLLAVTVMGFAMANQKRVPVQHIVEFKENLRVMLIASIFILLAASLRPEDLALLSPGSVLFLLALFLVIRPATVFVSTLGGRLSHDEKLFLSWMAPRGIVAAAVSSIFSLRLHEAGHPGADSLVAVTFLVIIATVTVYGLSAGYMAKRLGLAKANPDGVLILGGRFWARRIAKAIKDEGYPVMLVDNDRHNVLAARMEGVPAYYASVFSEPVLEQVELGGIGKLLALTGNDDTNSLAGLHFAPVFGRDQIFQLAAEEKPLKEEISKHLRGRTAFGEDITHILLTQRFLADWTIRKTKLSKEFDYEAFKAKTRGEAIPLFLITEQGRLRVFNAESALTPQPGQTLISLARPRGEAGSAGPAAASAAV